MGNAENLKKALDPFKPMGSAQSISCSFNLPGNTLVPDAVFREEHRADYLDFNLGHSEQSSIESDELVLMEARNVYGLHEAHRQINAIFPQCLFLHESSVEIELALRISRMEKRNAVYLFFGSGFFRLLVVRDGELQLANTFQHGSEMDVAYYVLYVFDQLKIDGKNNTTYASGAIDENGSELNLLREYIGPVRILTHCGLADVDFTSEKPGEVQRLFTLFHQVLCAL